MSELEHCRMAQEGNINGLKEKIDSNHFENLIIKKDQVKNFHLNRIFEEFIFCKVRTHSSSLGLCWWKKRSGRFSG